jgi:type IV pilus assembly protein PilA
MPLSRHWVDRLKNPRGFTLIEMMAVLAIIAILAMIAIPSQMDRIVKEQVVEGIKLAEIATKRVDAFWIITGKLPDSNETLDLPSADKIVNSRVSSITVEKGAVHIRFGNQASAALHGKVLSLRPAVVDDAPAVPITWICAQGKIPDKMIAKGDNRTEIKIGSLPMRCT